VDQVLAQKIEKFCDGLEELLPYFSPIERAVAEAIHEYWQVHKPVVRREA
jgi:hypothetical protein